MVFPGADPGIFAWGEGRVQTLVQKEMLNFFKITSHRDKHMFLNLRTQVTVGTENTALLKEYCSNKHQFGWGGLDPRTPRPSPLICHWFLTFDCMDKTLPSSNVNIFMYQTQSLQLST